MASNLYKMLYFLFQGGRDAGYVSVSVEERPVHRERNLPYIDAIKYGITQGGVYPYTVIIQHSTILD